MLRRLAPTLLIALLITTSCNSLIKYDVLIDNPHFSDLEVMVGEESYNVPGFEDLEVELPRGEVQVSATNEDGEVIFDEMVDVTGDGILNPTGATYVIWADLYLEDLGMYDVYAMSALDMEEVVMVEGNEYNDVDFEVFEGDVFIEEDWDYGLDDAWPDEVSISSSYTVKSKVYRSEQLEEDWGFWGDFDFSDYTDEDFDGLLDSLQQVLDGMEDLDLVDEE